MARKQKYKFELNPLRGIKWRDDDRKFPDSASAQAPVIRNFHVVWIDEKWCVHGEMEKDVQLFSDKQSAIDFARAKAQEMRTQAMLHSQDGSIETTWVYDSRAFPQEKVFAQDQYPIQQDPGDKVL